MTAHKHADLMLLYAQDAAETDKPWERWEILRGKSWCNLTENPTWIEYMEYRRKPQIIKVGRHEFPKPITESPEEGTDYFYIDVGNTCFEVNGSIWTDDVNDVMRLESGRMHLTHEAAQAHADVLNAVCRGDVA